MGRHTAPKRRRLLARAVRRVWWCLRRQWRRATAVVEDTVPRRAWPDPRPRMTAPLIPLAPVTLHHPVVPDTVSDIDPGTAIPELPPSTLTADQALSLLHAQHCDLPRSRVHWRCLDDGVFGEVYVLEGAEIEHRAIICMYAGALGVEMVERVREPAEDGYSVVYAAGPYGGVQFVVEAVVAPDISVPMRIFEEASGDPSLSDPPTQAIPVITLHDEAPAAKAVEA